MSTKKYIVFQLNEREYGTSIKDIISIERVQEVVPLPKVSSFIEGVTKLRDDVVPVVDLKLRMALPQSEGTDQSRMLVTSVDGVAVGFIVDTASDVIDIDDTTIKPAPKTIKGINVDFLSGVAKLDERLLLIVDLAFVLNYEELSEVKEVVSDEEKRESEE